MKISAMIENLRKSFTSLGMVELMPCFADLSAMQLHPDFFFRLFAENQFKCFCIQPRFDCRFFEDLHSDMPTLSLNLMIKPFSLDIWPKISAVLSELGQDLKPALTGLPFEPDYLFNSGAVWEIRLSGISCGNLLVLTKVADKPLPGPVAFIAADLPSLWLITGGDPRTCAGNWAVDMSYADLLSLKFFPCLKSANSTSGYPTPTRAACIESPGELCVTLKNQFEAALSENDISKAFCALLTAYDNSPKPLARGKNAEHEIELQAFVKKACHQIFDKFGELFSPEGDACL